jgi:putative endopeptidase
MTRAKRALAFMVLGLVAGCAAPSQKAVVRAPSAAAPIWVPPVFHSSETVTRDELYQNARVPAHRDFPLSTTVKPCDDFYGYVCSEVKSHYTLPDDRSMHNFTLSDPDERLLAAKKNYLAFLQNKRQLTERQKVLKANYVSCLNEKARTVEEQRFVALGKEQIEPLANLEQFRQFMSKRIISSDFSIVGASFDENDITNRDKHMVYISTGAMTLPERSYYHDPAVRDAVKKIFALFFKTIGRDDGDARAQKLLDFETQIADIKPLPREMRPRVVSTAYIVGKTELRSKYPALMLEPVLEKVPAGINIDNLMPETAQFMNDQLASGDLETWKDYALYHSLSGTMDEAYPEFFNAKFQFSNQFLGGSIQRPDLIERCASFVDDQFEFELSAELLPILYSPDTQIKVEKIAQEIRATKLKEIQENKWISEEGRAGALEKMKKLRLMIFKPKTDSDWNFNAVGVAYQNDTYLLNKKNLALANMWRDIKRVPTKRNHNRWGMAPTTVNAYYSPSDNLFVLPAAIFQAPFFEENAPEYLNIGSIGSVTGHEIGHSIDDQGANFDANGEIHQWLSKADLTEFHKQADDKLIKLFDHITVDGHPHDGKLTLGENIGDDVGIHSAYRTAFGGLSKTNPTELTSMKQKFFEQYARTWCYVARPKAVEAQLKTNVHAVGEGRVNGQVVQMNGFYEAFSCKASDKMYVAPEERVNIW